MPDVAKLICKAFQLCAVFIDGHITLIGTAQFRLVVEEEPFDGGPEGEGSGVRPVDDVEDRLGDGCEDPIDDAGIGQLPFSVAIGRRGGGVNVAGEPELAKNGVEEAPPLHWE